MARRRFAIGRLALLLTLAFVGVALAGIFALAVLTTRSSNRDIANLIRHRERTITKSAALGTATAYRVAGGTTTRDVWPETVVDPLLALLDSEGAKTQIRDLNGTVVATTSNFNSISPVAQVTEPVVVDGRQVGSLTLRFTQKISAIPMLFDLSRWYDRLSAAGLASLLALVVTLVLSWWITAPVDTVLTAMRRRGSGDRDYRISEREMRGARPLRQLLVSFNQSTDEADARERAHRNLIADVAHELRTPVAILLATHEAMLDGVSEPTPENLGSLREEVLRLARRVEDLQQLASAESAALQLDRARRDLAEIAADAVASMADAFEGADVALIRRFASVDVLCDPERMREIIMNLLTNALKFTPAGGRVVVGVGPAGQDSAVLTVTDTGIGIPADELPRVTERFFRGQRSAEMAQGSGIGLTIVSELVEAHRGRVEFTSEPGEGTEVKVTLPAEFR